MSRIAFFPTLFAICVAILGLGFPIPGSSTSGTPWLVAVHNQTMSDGQVAQVDTLGFFLWGQQYTVVGTKMIQNQFVVYDGRDFPFYSMILMIIGIIAGLIAITVDRTYRIKLDREYILTNKLNPVYPLLVAVVTTGMSTLYLFLTSMSLVIPMFVNSGYITRFSYGIQFMFVSVVGFSIALLLTYMNSPSRKEQVPKIPDDLKSLI